MLTLRFRYNIIYLVTSYEENIFLDNDFGSDLG